MEFLTILVVVIFLIINYVNKRILKNEYKILNPLSLYLYVWIAVIIIHCKYFDINNYNIVIYLLIIFGSFTLAFGFWIGLRLRRSDREILILNEDINFNEVRKLIFWLTILEIVRVLYITWIVYKLAGSWDVFINSNTYVRRLYLSRSSSLFGNILEFFLNSNAMLGQALIGIYASYKVRDAKRYIILWFLMELLYSIVTMSKMCFICFILVVLISYLNGIKKINEQKKIIRMYTPIIISVIFALLILVGKQRNYTQFGDSIVNVVIDKAAFYFSSSIEALGRYIQTYRSPLELGQNSFKLIFRSLSRLGILKDTSTLGHIKFINIDDEATNVYTWYRTFYLDYSYSGFVLVPFVIGFISGKIYKPNNKRIYLHVLISWISVVIALSFYEYLWGQTIYIFILLYAYIIDKIFRKKLYKVY